MLRPLDRRNPIASEPSPAAPASARPAALSVQDGFDGARAPNAVSDPRTLSSDGLFGKSPQNQFSDDTADFRSTANSIRSLTTQLAGLSPSDPKYAGLKAELATATTHMQATYGYSATNLPAPGSIWVDPRLLSSAIPGDKLSASQFPVSAPVTKPPSAIDALFASGQPYHLLTDDGKTLTFNTPAQYEQWLAQNQAANGMPVTTGIPTGVQMNFEGGGGKGKRYGPALAELESNGVVPTSCCGSSAGAIAAALVAAGADPVEVNRFITDPALSKLLDIGIPSHGGLSNGQAAYDLINQELQKLTGITNRPVTFADLKIPLQVVATKASDSNPAPGTGDLTQIQNREFVFSQQTTPNTPVALAVRASMAIPGLFAPVQMVDPTTGRQISLVDGGVLDDLPMHESPNFGLPTVGLSLLSRDDDNPAGHTQQPKALPSGNLDVGDVLLNALYGKEMNDDAQSSTDDFHDRTQPKPGQFMLGLPIWNLQNPTQSDSTLSFGYDSSVDPTIDTQTRQVARDFCRQVLGELGKPGASYTNVSSAIPANLEFTRDVTVNGHSYVATYSGGDDIHFQPTDGSAALNINVGAQKIAAMYLDDLSFHDLPYQLAAAVNGN